MITILMPSVLGKDKRAITKALGSHLCGEDTLDWNLQVHIHSFEKG